MAVTVKQLKQMLEQLNIPDDAEIWIEFPLVNGVRSDAEPTHEIRYTEREEREDWIVGSTVGWSSSDNKVRIFHQITEEG